MSKVNNYRKIPLDIFFSAYREPPSEPNWKLVRKRDGLEKYSTDVKWIEFPEDGLPKLRDDIAIHRSLLMSPFNVYFTWQTTLVTKIIEQFEGYIKFETENSVYELFKI